MQFKLAAVSLALATLAAATPARRGDAPTCSTGSAKCCNSVQPASSAAASKELSLLGIVLQDLTVPIGITCSPLTVVGVGSSTCTAQSVCCEDNSHGGLISIGCVPIQA